MKKILLYGLSDEESDCLQDCAAELGIPVYIVGDSALEEVLGRLFELNDDLDTRAEEFDEEFMIMDGMTRDDLLELLKVFDRHGFEFDGVKVMRTLSNEKWTLRELLKETQSEHRIAQRAMILTQLLKSCNMLDLSTMEPEERQKFKESLMDLFMLLQSGTYTLEQIDDCLHRVSDGLKAAHKLYN